jgi:hypothetical protein
MQEVCRSAPAGSHADRQYAIGATTATAATTINAFHRLTPGAQDAAPPATARITAVPRFGSFGGRVRDAAPAAR